ncbi:MAG TPA: fused response regulator/phosphatase [Phycisphaerae bacterium]|nr:fused response regulator/phosphatase [Phycisphaerae bacterium]HRY68067.1 fused response regulator/phosphatase [Phycisphaerae bacterium]HSA30153.1 fused response regulator/phosphatase [Phycisphaerae bacterium]
MGGASQVPVTLPTERETAHFCGVGQPEAVVTAARPNPRAPASSILVAEDDPDNQALIELLLQRAGYRVTLASDGDEVFGLLESCRPELLLLDCQMPRMDGPEVCARLKQDPYWADVPVIFLSMFSDPRDKVRGFEAGGADYVTKPIEELELLARIRNQLELARNRQTLKKKVSIYEALTQEQMARLDEIRTGQESLLTSPWAFPELKAAVRFTPAHEAGGDFYEITRFEDGEFGFLVTDVAGHDLSVPFITGALKALSVTFLKDGLSPTDTMTMLNASLCAFLTEERYVTGCYAKYSRERREVELINAGHPPALFQSTDRKCEFVNLSGDALGLLECVRFETRTLQVQPGDRLFLYSDGLIEGYRDALGRRGRPTWGMKQMQRCVESLRSKNITETVDAIVDELLDETGGMVEDDILVLGVEF